MSNDDTDLFDALVSARPTPTELDRAFPTERRAAVLTTAMHAGSSQRGHRVSWHRWLAVAAAGLLLGAGFIVRDVVSGDSAARADALAMVAQTAGRSTDLTIIEGTFLAQTATENPGGASEEEYGSDRYPRVMHSWTAADGRIWRCDVRPSGMTEYFAFPAPPAEQSPAAIAGLPTDPNKLKAQISSRVSGSNSHDEAIFVGLRDILTQASTPPAVQQAAVSALSTLNGVTVEHATAPSGRDLLEVRFFDRAVRGPEAQSMWFDESQGRVVETSSSNRDTGKITFATVYGPGQLVAAVPSDVLDLANPQGSDTPPIHAPTPQPPPSCQ